jgi:hypothetical protein
MKIQKLRFGPAGPRYDPNGNSDRDPIVRALDLSAQSRIDRGAQHAVPVRKTNIRFVSDYFLVYQSALTGV